MNRDRLVLILCVISLSFFNTSFRWPLDNLTVTSTFGESRWDHFHDGMDVISALNRVYPVTKGSMVYYWSRSRFPLDNYPGMGNFVIIDHGNSILGVYGHLADGGIVKESYLETDEIGIIGNTGHSMAPHLHFSLLNMKEEKSINPLILLPQVPDDKPPAHLETFFKIGERYIPIRPKTNYRITRHHPVLMEIRDTISGRERLGVYRLTVHFNEKQILDALFSEICSRKNFLTIQGLSSDDLFDEKGYYRVSGIRYIEGENRLKIVALDYLGNRLESNLAFQVNLDIQQ